MNVPSLLSGSALAGLPLFAAGTSLAASPSGPTTTPLLVTTFHLKPEKSLEWLTQRVPG